MKAAIALLSDFHVQNIVRRMVFEISQYGDVEFFGSLLPAHVSLKQPFSFESMDTLQEWFESFSQRRDCLPKGTLRGRRANALLATPANAAGAMTESSVTPPNRTCE